jgi:hypothetical protein
MIWGIAHLATIGLLPIWMSNLEKYSGDLRDHQGAILYKFEKVCSASIWSWSPLILSDQWSNPNKLHNYFTEQCMNSIVFEIQKSGAL